MTAEKKKIGGSRKGKRNKSHEEVRALIDKVGKKYGGMGTMFERLFELGDGIRVSETDKRGEERTYTKAPDALAIKVLAEYRFGKPIQTIAGDVENPLTVKFVERLDE